MIMDELNIFSDAQAETTIGTHNSDDLVDLGAMGDAEVKKARLHIRVNTDLASSGSATIQYKLQTSDTEAFSSATDLWTSSALAYDADLSKAGEYPTGKGGIPIPSGCKRYLRVQYIIGTAALTGGKWDAFLTPDADTNYMGDFA